jgi:hypothetical protein
MSVGVAPCSRVHLFNANAWHPVQDNTDISSTMPDLIGHTPFWGDHGGVAATLQVAAITPTGWTLAVTSDLETFFISQNRENAKFAATAAAFD